MSKYLELAEETSDRYLDAVAKGQDSVLKAMSAWSQWAPKPALAADFSALREMTSAGFTFSEKLLEQQKAFADRMLNPVASSPAAESPVVEVVETAEDAAASEAPQS